MEWKELEPETERSILLILKDGEKSLAELVDLVPNISTKKWMRKKLDDFNRNGLIKNKIKYSKDSERRERHVSVDKRNVKFKEEKDFKQTIKPIAPSLLMVMGCFLLLIIGVIFNIMLLAFIFIGSLVGLLPSLFWLLYRLKTTPGHIRVLIKEKRPKKSLPTSAS